MNNECIFSSDRKYRYSLIHSWDDSLPIASFIGLNPSTADENELDPTLRRIKGFCKSWGYGRFVMLNIFAFRATDPDDMKAAGDPVGQDNDKHIHEFSATSDIVIACWGNHGSFADRGDHVISMLADAGVDLHCLKITQAGHPSHPLYLRSDTRPIGFNLYNTRDMLLGEQVEIIDIAECCMTCRNSSFHQDLSGTCKMLRNYIGETPQTEETWDADHKKTMQVPSMAIIGPYNYCERWEKKL